MFGIVICNKKGLEPEEKERYQSIYCGLCKALKKRFGQLERLSLSYDMTFLALFLTSLYEPEEEHTKFRCKMHPTHKKEAVENEYIDYAADMTVVLSYYKCMDDWEDENKRLSLKYAKVLEQNCKEIEKKYPRQCQAIAESIRELHQIEKSSEAKVDEAVNCNGKMLSEVFVYKEDFWENTLRVFGYEMGRFIYLMDATIDYKKDIKKGNYNPLLLMEKKPEEMEGILTNAIAKATYQFEKLPIVKDAHLIRNILYGGVWQQYYCMKDKK